LLVANELFVVRVGDTDLVSDEAAGAASVEVRRRASQIEIFSATAGPYDFNGVRADSTVIDYFFRWRLNGVLASKTLVVLNTANRPAPHTGDPYTATDLADELNSSWTPRTTASSSTSRRATRSASRRRSHTARTPAGVGVGPGRDVRRRRVGGNPSGLGTGMTQASTTGANDSTATAR
jgi:hypothetical protein